jgi:hypothetical protein
MIKMVKELKIGDRVELSDDAVATVIGVEINRLVQTYNDSTYLVRFRTDDGESGATFAGGRSKISVPS